MTLKKISETDYLLLDDSKIELGDYFYNKNIFKFSEANEKSLDKEFISQSKKIIKSTIPIENFYDQHLAPRIWCKIRPIIFSKELKNFLGINDIESKARKHYEEDPEFNRVLSFKSGYYLAIYDNRNKKWTDEDIIMAFRAGFGTKDCKVNEYNYLKLIQPQDEWIVEFNEGQELKLK